MYRIIGADGRQFGPASGEVVRRWIAEGRANGQTLAQAEGGADWKPLSAFPEFADLAAPPPVQGVPPSFPATGAHPLKHSPMAVTGFVCGLLGLLGPLCCCGPLVSILGLVFSIIGLGEIKRNPRQFTGDGFAIAGIVVSILGLLIFGLMLLFGFGTELLHGGRFPHRFIH